MPMCASWTGRIAAGTRSDRVALTMDLCATVCEAAGVPARGIDGLSLLGDATGTPAQTPARDLVWVRREGGLRTQAAISTLSAAAIGNSSRTPPSNRTNYTIWPAIRKKNAILPKQSPRSTVNSWKA